MNNLNIYKHDAYTDKCVFFHSPKYPPAFETAQAKFAREIKKKLILLCDQGVNHITCLSLNILLGKTRRLGSIV